LYVSQGSDLNRAIEFMESLEGSDPLDI
jgi:hypothetical protein